MIHINTDRCSGCGVCVNVCPQRALELRDKKAAIADYVACMECGACSLNCAEGAVELTKGTGCLFAIVKEDILKITPKGSGCGCSAGAKGSSCC